MAKRNDKDSRRTDLLPDPDEFYFDDDLDSVTRGLPTEEDYLPSEEEAEAEAQPLPMTEGFGRAGIRMVGLSPEAEADALAEEAGEEDEEEFEEAETVYSYSRSTYAEEDEEDEYLTPRQRERKQARNAAAQPIPVARSKAKKQQRVVPEEEDTKSKHPKLRMFVMITVTVVLLGAIGMMMLSRTMMPDTAILKLPENVVSTSVGPVQAFFSYLTESVADYFRTLKLRANLEQAYVDVLALNEQYAIDAAFVREYERRLAQYEAIDEEIQSNLEMNPVRCQVIGREQGNYFSTFTIDKGSRHGVEPYMAVTIDGALVGFTEEVYSTTSTVRTIIDSNASIACLIQSSRDQGIISGTLGIDGTAMCRMYYLPNDHLPRPGDMVFTSGIGMSFPEGIPVGTVRESTRGMDQNNQYIVVEPKVDFEHLEYVIVLRYKPAAGAVEGRESTASYNEYEPTVSARPYPTLRIGSTLRFGETATPAPTVSATPSPTPTATPTATPAPTATPTPAGPVLEYQSSLFGPTATPSPKPTPSPTPIITIDPSQMTWEDD